MKNFNLYLFHIELTWNESIEKKTLVAIDMNVFHNFLTQYSPFHLLKLMLSIKKSLKLEP